MTDKGGSILVVEVAATASRGYRCFDLSGRASFANAISVRSPHAAAKSLSTVARASCAAGASIQAPFVGWLLHVLIDPVMIQQRQLILG